MINENGETKREKKDQKRERARERARERERDSEAGLPDGIFSYQKIQIWVNCTGSFNGRCYYIYFGHLVFLGTFGTFCGNLVSLVVIWYILWTFGTFCGHLVRFVDIWYILWYFFPVLECCTVKNLATPERSLV
jgi:hypothetical protein